MAFDSSTWTDTRAATEEPKRWRNWWRTNHLIEFRCMDEGDGVPFCGRRETLAPGAAFNSCCNTFPSREAAEAQEREAKRTRNPKALTYLGAHPLEKHP